MHVMVGFGRSSAHSSPPESLLGIYFFPRVPGRRLADLEEARTVSK